MISRARLKFLRSLDRKKIRAQEGLLLVEGFNALEEAAAGGFLRELFFGDGAAEAERGRALIDRGLPLTRLESRDVDELTDTRTPMGAFGLVADPCRRFDAARLPEQALLLVAAGVADPGNLGTLIRTAAGLGADALVVTPGTVEPTNPKVVRASAGALFRIPVLRAEPRSIAMAGFELLLADVDGRPLAEWTGRGARTALLLGNEPRGIDAVWSEAAPTAIGIPLQAGVESLNVASAAAILLHALAALPVRDA